MPYSPLGRQWLTGAFDAAAIGEEDGRHHFPRFTVEHLAANRPVLDTVLEVAHEADATPAQIALAWLYDKARALGLPVVPIPGTRFPERVDENLAALGVELDAGQVARLDALAARVAGGRSFDSAWVSQGRE